jgi:hypothetical protein
LLQQYYSKFVKYFRIFILINYICPSIIIEPALRDNQFRLKIVFVFICLG